MTPEAQRIAIAEACGCVWQNMMRDSDVRRYESEGVLPLDSLLPDYLNDLNAMHEAVLPRLTATIEQDRFLDVLFTIIVAPVEVEYGSVKWNEHGLRWVFMHATAAQRSEAFLRTIGRWTEPPPFQRAEGEG